MMVLNLSSVTLPVFNLERIYFRIGSPEEILWFVHGLDVGRPMRSGGKLI